MGTTTTEYELGRHAERQRTMQLIGAVRMDAQTGARGDVLDKLIMSIVAEPLPDMMLDYARALATPADLAPAGERDEEEWVKQNPEAQLESAAGELVSREAVDEVQRRMDEDETILLINAVVDAAVEWHQAGREGAEWFDKAEVLGQSIDALLELRAKVDRAGSSTPTDEDDKGG